MMFQTHFSILFDTYGFPVCLLVAELLIAHQTRDINFERNQEKRFCAKLQANLTRNYNARNFCKLISKLESVRVTLSKANASTLLVASLVYSGTVFEGAMMWYAPSAGD